MQTADLTVFPLLTGLLAVAGGVALTIGVATPAASGVSVVSAVLLAFWPASALPVSRIGTALLVADAVAIVLLGPGAYSVDALLFGRREIVIPHESHAAGR